MLSLAGGLAGLLVAGWTRDLLWAMRPPMFATIALDLSLDPYVLSFALLKSTFSAWPAAPPSKTAKPATTFDPHRLIGLNYDEATSIAGKPADTRDEPPASVWRYRVEECFVDIYFYMDMGTQQFRALAYDKEARYSDCGKLEEAFEAVASPA